MYVSLSVNLCIFPTSQIDFGNWGRKQFRQFEKIATLYIYIYIYIALTDICGLNLSNMVLIHRSNINLAGDFPVFVFVFVFCR